MTGNSIKVKITGKKELWERIRNYKFNDLVPRSALGEIIEKLGGRNAAVRAFASKIMKKHNLPRAFVFRAIEEYKKFVYLGVISDFVVTPSKYIDLVWHEHILFSKGYRDFCNNVIDYQFDHQPELISTDGQTELYTAQYLETLDLYSKEFGMEPPENIWGIPKFNKENLNAGRRSVRKRSNNSDSGFGGDYSSEEPLHTNYDGDSFSSEFSGFDGGDGGGAGASGDFSGSGDGGDSGSCSSCSGGCGGGGD